jgi:choline dehydrogenase-like flavoprotein
MLSGVGPADELRRHGIEIVQESPGVGTSTTDHAVIRVWYKARGATEISRHTGAAFQHSLHYASDGEDSANDMCIMPTAVSMNGMLLAGTSLSQKARMLLSTIGSVPPSKLVEQVRRGWDQNLSVMLVNGENRGRIKLTSSDARDLPRIEHHYLEQEHDRVRLRDGVRLAAQVLESSRYAEAGVSRVQPLINSGASDAEVDRFMKEFLGTANHLASSARMGAEHTETTVVDAECRVFGVDGLRVADASIALTPSRRNTNATALVIGERVADLMR